MRTVVRRHPGARLLIAGRGDADAIRELVGDDLRAHVGLLGELSEADKAAFLRSVDIYCAPNLLGESFGVVLIEALAAGAPIVASDLDAFARVLEDGAAGVLVRRGDPAALAEALCGLLADPARLAELSAGGARAAAAYDWDVLARRILAVYETVLPPGGGEVTAGGRRPGRPERAPGEDGGALGPPPTGGALASPPRDARGLVAAGRRPGPPAGRVDGVDPRPAEPAGGPRRPRLDRPRRPAAAAGRPGRGAGPQLSGRARGGPGPVPGRVRGRRPRAHGRRPGARREPARAGAAGPARGARRHPDRPADRPRRHRHAGRTGPPLLQRRGARHRGAAAPPAVPAAAPARAPGRCRATSTSTTAWTGSTGAPTAPVRRAADPP